jgi:hypothetical protein
MAQETAKTSGRDVRVDRVGLVEELDRLWSAPMKKKIKEDMAKEGLEVVTADLCEAKLASSMSSWIDPVKFFKLFEKGEISRKDLLDTLSISKSAAAKFMSARDLEGVSLSEPGPAKLSIVRRKGIDLTLRQVIQGIAGATADLS